LSSNVVCCFRCGEVGHKVAECEKAEETQTVKNEDGTVREIYVPMEVTDDDLVESGNNEDWSDTHSIEAVEFNSDTEVLNMQDGMPGEEEMDELEVEDGMLVEEMGGRLRHVNSVTLAQDEQFMQETVVLIPMLSKEYLDRRERPRTRSNFRWCTLYEKQLDC
jgi:hypothetical protein